MRLYPFFIPHGGCPHRCRFCQQERTTGRTAAPTPEEVSQALAHNLPPTGAGEAAFYGGSFTLLPASVQRSYLGRVGPFIRSGRISGIRISTRPDALDGDAVALLAEMGVSTVEIGCQSFSPEVLRLSKRGHGPMVAEGAVSRLREAGLQVGIQLMPGLPGGDREEALYSLRRALALSPDFLRIYPAVVLRGSALEEAYRTGEYRPLSLDSAVDWCAELLWRCRREDVPVIRLGLQGTPELDSGEALVAGPYHPAFGQLVRSRLWLRALEKGSAVTGIKEAMVHPADFADAAGHRRFNLEILERCFRRFILQGRAAVPRGEFLMGQRRFSLAELASY